MNLSSHLRFAETQLKFEFHFGRNCSCPLKLKVLNTRGLEEFVSVIFIRQIHIVAYEATDSLRGAVFFLSRSRSDPESVNSDPGRQKKICI